MVQSTQFRKLERRLKKLKSHFLPKNYSPTGEYNAKQLDMARAYRLLCHAEIEEYVEVTSWSLAQKKIATAKSSGKASLTTLTLLAYHRLGWGDLLDSDTASSVIKKNNERNPFKEPLGALLEESLLAYRHRIVDKNNGIKTENLQRLLKPIGVDFEELNQGWLIAINEFGKLRGETAHTSAYGVTHVIDPKTEADLIETVFLGLKTLDTLLGQLLKSHK